MGVIFISAGNDELHLVQHLGPEIKAGFKEVLPDDRFAKEVALSDDTVLTRLKLAFKTDPSSTICVICDAETRTAQQLWNRFIPVLRDAGYSLVPDRLPATGLILDQPDYHRIGIWIMPNNTDTGMIEDFYLRAIPDEDRELNLAHAFVTSIPNPKFGIKISKSKYRVWLAIQKVPFGPAQALSTKQVSRERGEIPAFIQWLSKLLQLPESL